jgi:hypothetical protein
MEDLPQRYAHLVCSRSKSGDSLAQISELVDYSADQVVEILAKAVNLTPLEVRVILRLKHRGLPNQQISQEFLVEVEILDKFLSDSVVYPSIGEEPTVQTKSKDTAPKVTVKVPKVTAQAPKVTAQAPKVTVQAPKVGFGIRAKEPSSSSSSSDDGPQIGFGFKGKAEIKAPRVVISASSSSDD